MFRMRPNGTGGTSWRRGSCLLIRRYNKMAPGKRLPHDRLARIQMSAQREMGAEECKKADSLTPSEHRTACNHNCNYDLTMCTTQNCNFKCDVT